MRVEDLFSREPEASASNRWHHAIATSAVSTGHALLLPQVTDFFGLTLALPKTPRILRIDMCSH